MMLFGVLMSFEEFFTLALKRFIIFAVVTVFVIMLALSLFVYINSQKPYTGNVESITVSTILLEPSISVFVADEQNFFAQNGLNVTLKYYDTGLASVNALLNGEANISSSTADYVFAGKVLQNQPIEAIATHNKVEYDFIVARKDHGINNISDLEGKRIGVIRNTHLEFFLSRFLELNGVNPESVTFVNITQVSQTVTAVVSGNVDAVITVPPYVQAAQNQLGDNAVIWPAQSNQQLQHLLISKTDLINQHPELIERFLKAMFQAEQFIESNPNEVKAIAQQRLDFAAEEVDRVWSRNDFSLSLDQPLIVAMRDEAQWMINNNLTNQTHVPDFVNYIYTDALEAVKPESVNIIG